MLAGFPAAMQSLGTSLLTTDPAPITARSPMVTPFRMMLFAPMIAEWALNFGPPEYCVLMLFGLSSVAALSGSSLVKGLMAMTFGLMLSTIGTDITKIYSPRAIES
jgi:putative tricarboxylic transport membrane protein